MYILIKNKLKKSKVNFIDGEVYSYKMPNKNGFYIEGNSISNIIIYNKKLAHPLVSKIVDNKFNKLIDKITELLVSEDSDDEGDTYREALTLIEKFRVLVKNKYRSFLKKNELEKMSDKLKILQKECNKKILNITNINTKSKNTRKWY